MSYSTIYKALLIGLITMAVLCVCGCDTFDDGHSPSSSENRDGNGNNDDDSNDGNSQGAILALNVSPSWNICFDDYNSEQSICITAMLTGDCSWYIDTGDTTWLSVTPASGTWKSGECKTLLFSIDRTDITGHVCATVVLHIGKSAYPLIVTCDVRDDVPGDDPDKEPSTPGEQPSETPGDPQPPTPTNYTLPEGTTEYYETLAIPADGIELRPPMIDSSEWTMSFYLTASTSGNIFYVERDDAAIMQSLSICAGMLYYAMSTDSNSYAFPAEWMSLGSSKVNDGKRRHIVLTSRRGVYSSNDVVTTLYINGKEQGSAIELHNELTDPHIGRGVAMHIGGSRTVNLLTTLDGARMNLEHIRIYASKALTATEAYALYKAEE